MKNNTLMVSTITLAKKAISGLSWAGLQLGFSPARTHTHRFAGTTSRAGRGAGGEGWGALCGGAG